MLSGNDLSPSNKLELHKYMSITFKYIAIYILISTSKENIQKELTFAIHFLDEINISRPNGFSHNDMEL